MTCRGGVRTLVSSDPIVLSTEAEREALEISIFDRLYIVLEYALTYIYHNNEWIRLTGNNINTPHNYLDNSYFINPINQRGYDFVSELSEYEYFIDRWVISNAGCIISKDSNGIYINSTNKTLNHAIDITQCIGKAMTFIVKHDYGVSIINIDCVPSATESFANHVSKSVNYMTLQFNSNLYRWVVSIIPLVENLHIQWAALYEGTYNKYNYPEYVYKGYEAELSECQRYYENSWGNDTNKIYNFYDALMWNLTESDAVVNYRVIKRITPTVTFTGVCKYYTNNYYDLYNGLSDLSIPYSYTTGFTARLKKSSTETFEWHISGMMQILCHWEASADL